MRGSKPGVINRARSPRATSTDAEQRLWSRLRGRQVGGHNFVRQLPIGAYVAAFVCRDLKLVVEVDGSQHADSTHDVVRDEFMRAEGYHLKRFRNGDVMHRVDQVLDTILAECESLGIQAPHPVALTCDSTSPRLRRGEEKISLADDLRAAIPGLRGTIEADAPLASLSWFRTGGAAEVLFTPADEADLALFLRGCPAELPVLVVGLGSNLLVRDGGVPGVVVRLGKGFGAISVEAGRRVRAGAGAPDVKVARAAAEAGIDGLAFLRGIPGAIGGALRMNGGAYGGEVADVLVEARALDRRGQAHVLSRAALDFTYRHCGAPADLVFTEALFEGRPGDPAAILAAMAAITDQRSATQPVNTRTGGSTFKNPPGAKAWELVDRAGCRGLRAGAAQVSEMHCNFLVNHGGASAAEIEQLGEEVRRRVRDTCGVELEWEIKRVGTS